MQTNLSVTNKVHRAEAASIVEIWSNVLICVVVAIDELIVWRGDKQIRGREGGMLDCVQG